MILLDPLPLRSIPCHWPLLDDDIWPCGSLLRHCPCCCFCCWSPWILLARDDTFLVVRRVNLGVPNLPRPLGEKCVCRYTRFVSVPSFPSSIGERVDHHDRGIDNGPASFWSFREMPHEWHKSRNRIEYHSNCKWVNHEDYIENHHCHCDSESHNHHCHHQHCRHQDWNDHQRERNNRHRDDQRYERCALLPWAMPWCNASNEGIDSGRARMDDTRYRTSCVVKRSSCCC